MTALAQRQVKGIGRLGLWLLALVLWASTAWAQLSTEQQAVLEKWRATAQRAEAAVEANRASNTALEALRADLAQYRRTFEVGRQQNSSRFDTLTAQLDALGPAPAEGGSEPEEIATLRAELTERIAKLRVPVVVYQEAFSRANGLISEIDRLIRDRQTRRLLSRTDSPLTPKSWPLALGDIGDALTNLRNETAANLSNSLGNGQLRAIAPRSIVLALAGLVLLIMGRMWAAQMGAFMRTFGGNGYGIWGFLISLGRIVLPLAGVFLIAQAIVQSNILGLRGERILAAVPGWAMTLLGLQWLAERVFARFDGTAIVQMEPSLRAAMRRNFLAIGLVLVLHEMLVLFADIEKISATARGVLGLPIIVLGALVLLRMRRIVRREFALRAEAAEAGSGQVGLARLWPFVLLASLLIALAAPLLSIAGYGTLAEGLIFPYLKSIVLLAIVLVAQRFFRDLYAWVVGRVTSDDDSIVPVLINFILAAAALPFLSLLWGAREDDLTEIWGRFLQGVSVGETRISPVDFLTFAVVFMVGYTLTRLLQGALKGSLLPKTKIDIGGQTALVSGVGYVGIFLAALIAVSTAGIDLSSLAIVAGALSVGIGFGLQNIVSNFVSGIILLIERPVAEGDWIEVGGQMGYVRDISVRSTRIETFDRTDVIVPNSELVSGTVTNYTRGNTIGRLIVPVGVAYGSDIDVVEGILNDVAQAHPMVLGNPAPSVVFQRFGGDSLDFEIRAILRDVNFVLSVKSQMNHEIYRRFAEEGIEIPFAQRDVWLRNPEALVPKSVPAKRPAEASATEPELEDMPGQSGHRDANEGDDD